MSPAFAVQNTIDSGTDYAEPLADLDGGNALRAENPDFAYGGLCEFGLTVGFASRQEFRVQSRRMVVAPGPALRMFPRTISVSSCQTLRMRSRGISITSGSTLWMRSRAIGVTPGDTFWMRSRTVPVASCGMETNAMGIPFGLSPFLDHVGRVFSGAPKKQVIGPNACRDIATVADPKILKDWAYEELIGNPVGVAAFPGKPKGAISRIERPRRPEPASRSDLDFRHEPSKNLGVRAGKRSRCYDGISHGRSSYKGLVVRSEVSVGSTSSGRLNCTAEGASNE